MIRAVPFVVATGMALISASALAQISDDRVPYCNRTGGCTTLAHFVDSNLWQDAEGDIGIGGAPGTYKLKVNGLTYFGNTLRVVGSLYLYGGNILDSGGDSRVSFWDTGILSLRTDVGVAALTVGTTGNVGIGTTAPASKLHVASGDVALAAGYGVILRNGSACFSLKINSDGSIIFISGTTRLPAVTCPQ
jgi:hypothetical protein